jgi:hypothetical protein
MFAELALLLLLPLLQAAQRSTAAPRAPTATMRDNDPGTRTEPKLSILILLAGSALKLI